jgi:hypothetical protein
MTGDKAQVEARHNLVHIFNELDCEDDSFRDAIQVPFESVIQSRAC